MKRKQPLQGAALRSHIEKNRKVDIERIQHDIDKRAETEIGTIEQIADVLPLLFKISIYTIPIILGTIATLKMVWFIISL